MAWIESHTVLTRHRKVLLLAHDLKIPVVHAIGHLHAFWHTILEQQEDGDLTEWPDAMIEEAALWEGAPGEFVTHLRSRGWIDGHLVHDWLDYTGPYLTKKYHSGNPTILKQIWIKHGYKYGKGQGKYIKQKGSKKEVVSQCKISIPNPSSPNPSSPNPSSPNPSSPNQPKDKEKDYEQLTSLVATPTARVWEMYDAAYVERYGTPPVRNAKVNGQIAQLVKRIGGEVAPQVAAFYVHHNDAYYVRSRHPPGLLLRDCEGLHTQWVTGKTVTQSQARKIDETAGRVNVFQELINERNGFIIDVKTT